MYLKFENPYCAFLFFKSTKNGKKIYFLCWLIWWWNFLNFFERMLLFYFFSYPLVEMAQIQTWSLLLRNQQTANQLRRCRDTVRKTTSSCHLWRTMILPGILHSHSIVIPYITLEAVRIPNQGRYHFIPFISNYYFFSYLFRPKYLSLFIRKRCHKS